MKSRIWEVKVYLIIVTSRGAGIPLNSIADSSECGWSGAGLILSKRMPSTPRSPIIIGQAFAKLSYYDVYIYYSPCQVIAIAYFLFLHFDSWWRLSFSG